MTHNNPLLRSKIAQDARARLLAANLAGIKDHIFVARASMVPVEQLPALLIFAPDLEASPLGAFWDLEVENLTLSLEIQMRFTPIDQTPLGDWATKAEALSLSVLSVLMQDKDWRRLWRGPPSVSCRQFLRGADVSDIPLIGETISLQLKPKHHLVWPLDHDPLSGVDVQIEQRQDTINLTLEGQ